VLDSVVQSRPPSRGQLPADKIQISGNFSQSRPRTWRWPQVRLAAGGARPPDHADRQRLAGEDSLPGRRCRGIVGLILVALYMVAYYRRWGRGVLVSACGARCCTRSSAGFGSTQGLALTLAGVTGIIVSVGVTVDSYVVSSND